MQYPCCVQPVTSEGQCHTTTVDLPSQVEPRVTSRHLPKADHYRLMRMRILRHAHHGSRHLLHLVFVEQVVELDQRACDQVGRVGEPRELARLGLEGDEGVGK